MSSERRYTLTLSCPDRIGIVAAVSTFLAEKHGWIVVSNQHADSESGKFFYRQEILADSMTSTLDEFRESFMPIAQKFDMTWQLSDAAVKKRVVILVSKLDHCLYDLLGRWKYGELSIDIPCVISNHEDLRELVEWHGIVFHHVPVNPDNKREAYARIADYFDEAKGDVMVLARYMQVLSPELCARYAGRIINIHHSFLPAFVGGKPYHQAFIRGVKLIGATCHYVTEDLDEGPIIDQDVISIDHSDSIADLVRYGRDIEKSTLARGLRSHLEDRVIVSGHKTVVFR